MKKNEKYGNKNGLLEELRSCLDYLYTSKLRMDKDILEQGKIKTRGSHS